MENNLLYISNSNSAKAIEYEDVHGISSYLGDILVKVGSHTQVKSNNTSDLLAMHLILQTEMLTQNNVSYNLPIWLSIVKHAITLIYTWHLNIIYHAR